MDKSRSFHRLHPRSPFDGRFINRDDVERLADKVKPRLDCSNDEAWTIACEWVAPMTPQREARIMQGL